MSAKLTVAVIAGYFLLWVFRFNCINTYFEIGLLTAIYFHRIHGSRLDATEIALVLAK